MVWLVHKLHHRDEAEGVVRLDCEGHSRGGQWVEFLQERAGRLPTWPSSEAESQARSYCRDSSILETSRKGGGQRKD